jgi:hypothetical protein
VFTIAELGLSACLLALHACGVNGTLWLLLGAVGLVTPLLAAAVYRQLIYCSTVAVSQLTASSN